MTFYAALIDLLGRCAPEMHVSALESRSNNPGVSVSVKRPITDKEHKTSKTSNLHAPLKIIAAA